MKLLVTLGPSSFKEKIISDMDKVGVDLYRLNMSHTPVERIANDIDRLKEITDTPICIDTEGAQIRSYIMKNNGVFLKKDDLINISFDPIEGDSQNIFFTPKFVAKKLIEGDIINIDFDSASIQVLEINKNGCTAKVISDGQVESNKAVDINRLFPLKPITIKDYKAIQIAKERGINHFALSFASGNEDVDLFRNEIGKNKFLISKIENESALLNLRSIIDKSNAILIDRGDLSRQLPLAKIPFIQRNIVATSKAMRKPVFVATNLLESMVVSKTPSRAELNDVVSTLMDGASGLVLAAETAIGNYPVECVKMLHSLVKQSERWSEEITMTEILNNN